MDTDNTQVPDGELDAAQKARKSSGLKRSLAWRKPFLQAYAKVGIIGMAARAAGIDRSTVARTRRRDPKFAEKMELAEQDAADILESVARQRAIRADQPSDTLLIFLLKSLRPQKYRERQTIEHTGSGGGPVEIQQTGTVVLLPSDGFDEAAMRIANGDNPNTTRAADRLPC